MNLISSFKNLLLAVGRVLWRLTWLLLGLGLVIGLVLMGALVWLIARLLGKKPAPVKVRWGAMKPPPFGRRPKAAMDDGEVVDVQARELSDADVHPGRSAQTPGTTPILPAPRQDG